MYSCSASDVTGCIAWSKGMSERLESFHAICDCEPIKSFTIQIFSSEALFMGNIPPETLYLFHLHVYCSLFLLFIVDIFCIFKVAAV